MDYFITGLPRSRTAWLANFLTTGLTYCHHDATLTGPQPSKLRKLAEETRKDTRAVWVGDSDSGLLVTAAATAKAFPQARWVMVRRDPEDAAESYIKYFKAHPYPSVPFISEEHARGMMKFCAHFLARIPEAIPEKLLLEVDYEDLNSEDTIRAIWEWCVPSLPFSRRRWQMLQAFNVSVMSEQVSAPTLSQADLLEAMSWG